MRDLKLSYHDEKKPVTGKTIRDITPAAPGAKDWQPCAWSPKTNLLYIPHQNLAMDYEGTEASYIEGTPGRRVRETTEQEREETRQRVAAAYSRVSRA